MTKINKNFQKLITLMKNKGVDYYLVGTTDEFLNEYVPDYNMRLKWLTNFSGSNGYALVSKLKKHFFTDGRYILQAKKELSSDYIIHDISKENLVEFLNKKLKKQKILLDMKIFQKKLISKINEGLKNSGNKIIHDTNNLIDLAWIDKPKEKIKKFFLLDKKFHGLSFQQKLSKIKPKNNDLLLVTSPESICWLLNIRGYDLNYTPIVFCRLIITKEKIEFFVNKNKIPDDFDTVYKNVITYDIKVFEKKLGSLKNETIRVDNEVSYFFKILLKKNNLIFQDDPCKILKAKKNKIEIKCSKDAHIHDGVALVKFFCWLEENQKKKKLTEYEASQILEKFRLENNDFFSQSFPTISATGPNGSIIHYKPKKKSLILKNNDLYLCDSGGQYFGGTTDITRTIYLGNKTPSNYIKNIYTRVLIGHLNLSTLKFPVGTRGYQIDSIARFNLWNEGLDYNHGTGHGVGSFLGVHEGPQSISKNYSNIVLEPGMIISNEPGYYENKKFGVRIENLVLVKKSKFKNFYEFETLSLFPYEKKLINFHLLTTNQKEWLADYHSHLFSKISPFLDKKNKSWLKKKVMTFENLIFN